MDARGITVGEEFTVEGRVPSFESAMQLENTLCMLILYVVKYETEFRG